MLHLLLHLLVPAAIALCFYRKKALFVFGIMMAGMLVDVDHLLASPIYDPGRCSMGFHPLHTLPAVLVYAVLCVPSATRLLGAGLIVHMLLDTGDCLTMEQGLEKMRENLVLFHSGVSVKAV